MPQKSAAYALTSRGSRLCRRIRTQSRSRCDFQQFVAGMATLCFKQGWALSGLTIATQANEVQAKCPSSSRCLIMEPNRDIASSMKTRRSGEFRGNPRLSANLTRAMDG